MNLNEQLRQAYKAGRQQALNESIPKHKVPFLRRLQGWHYDPNRDQMVNPNYSDPDVHADEMKFQFSIPFGGPDPNPYDYNDGVAPPGYDYWDENMGMWRRKYTTGPFAEQFASKAMPQKQTRQQMSAAPAPGVVPKGPYPKNPYEHQLYCWGGECWTWINGHWWTTPNPPPRSGASPSL